MVGDRAGEYGRGWMSDSRINGQEGTEKWKGHGSKSSKGMERRRISINGNDNYMDTKVGGDSWQ